MDPAPTGLYLYGPPLSLLVALRLCCGQGAGGLLRAATGASGQAAPAGGLTAALARSRKEENYLKYLAFAGHLNLELGKRAEFDQKPVLTALYRNRKAVLGLVGGRCSVTGKIGRAHV